MEDLLNLVILSFCLMIFGCRTAAPTPAPIAPPPVIIVPTPPPPELKTDWESYKVQLTRGNTDFMAVGWEGIDMGLREDGVIMWRVKIST